MKIAFANSKKETVIVESFSWGVLVKSKGTGGKEGGDLVRVSWNDVHKLLEEAEKNGWKASTMEG